MSVSTERSFLAESQWDPHSECNSMISFDMTQPHSPTSPSKFFKNSEDKRGMFDRLSNFFKKEKRKKSSGRQHSDASTSPGSPASPLSPRSPQSQQQDGPQTASQKDSEPAVAGTGAERGDSLSQSSGPSASSTASLVMGEAQLPFADSNSSGRSSVREVHVCSVSGASSQKNSENATEDLTATTHPSADSSSEMGFARSVVEEVNKKLQVSLEEVNLEDTKGSSENNAVDQTTFKIPLSSSAEAPKSPNLTSISLASKKTMVKVGEKGHSTALRGITLGSQSSTSHLITTQQEDGDSSDAVRKSSEVDTRGPIFSWEPAAAARGPSPEKGQVPRGDSPVQIHKAIWVETHLGEEVEWEREGEKEKDKMREGEESFRADSPPVLAIPVTVIPEDDSVTQGAADSPRTPSAEPLLSSGSPPDSTVSLAAAAGDCQTTLPQPEQPVTGAHSRQSSLQEKRGSREIRVTRKTVNLPSKHKVIAQNVCVSSDGSEPAGEEPSRDSTSETSDTTGVKPLPSLQNNNVELKEADLESLPATDETTCSDTVTPEPPVKERTDSEASDFDDTSAASDMHRAKSQAVRSGIRGQGTIQATPSKRGVKAAAESWHSAASGAKTPPSAAGSKAKNVTTKAKAPTESTKVGTSSDMPPQREYNSDKAVSMLPTLKDQSTSGPLSATGSKSKIPKRSTSDADVKSPVTPDKTSVSDASGSAAPSRLQIQPRNKDSLKFPVTAAKVGRKSSFEEAKGGKALSGDTSPTKTTHRTGTKDVKEKSDEDRDPTNLVNGVARDRVESSITTGHPTDKENLDVKKQSHQDSKAATKSRLPVSSQERKTHDVITQTSGANVKTITSSQTESGRPKTEQEEVRGERPAGETPPPLSESPKKGSMSPSKPVFKSHKESDTPASCVSPPPTNKDKTVLLRLSKQSDNIQHHKSPAKASADLSSSVSKSPTKGQRSLNKVKFGKLSPAENSESTPAPNQEEPSETTDREAAVEAPESVSRIQSDEATEEQESQFSPKKCQEEVKEEDILETSQLISNIKPDLIQKKSFSEPDSAVWAPDTIAAYEDVTDMSAKPVVADSIHCDIMTHSDQDAIVPGGVSLPKTNKVTSNVYNAKNSLPVKLISKEPKDTLPASPAALPADDNLHKC
ncbi:platelet binding protein GspB-like [Pempheris klunzingeri]|uniref:platelet binding protein GspB-like n=1 Tax=Pempheris klunzingeri TaxID=3127111 RepID=UPI0039806F13